MSWPNARAASCQRAARAREANYLAINLAHEIVIGERTVEEARDRYAQAMRAMTEGRDDPYTKGLLFDPPSGGTANPDQEVL